MNENKFVKGDVIRLKDKFKTDENEIERLILGLNYDKTKYSFTPVNLVGNIFEPDNPIEILNTLSVHDGEQVYWEDISVIVNMYCLDTQYMLTITLKTII